MLDYKGEKFKEFLNKNRIGATKAAEILGVSRQNVYQYFKSLSLGRETVNSILLKFDVTEDEIFGTTNDATIRNIRQNAREIGDLAIYDDEGNNKFTEISPGRYRMGVDLVPEYAQAGYLTGYADREFIEELPKHYITVDKFVRGKYMGFEISGDSMDNGDIKEAMPHGTIATGREVKRELWNSKLHNHQWPNWIFVHKTEGIIAKQIANQCLESGILTLKSLNPDKKRYPDFEINIDDLVQIYNVVKRELR
ncbi:hypothetical protein [Sphingobacterium hungaricum]|uniref:Uncharacterized protein n=1 Tax=Sphingobacterium hungaricum TaxID=2082723 RepID=A0A928UTH4_9SPHI|nr:hypothetical protein [Sphingobacterium hungaricum]MBE8712568.1 hypothetical protein [Sphingobacterium hungaricum]